MEYRAYGSCGFQTSVLGFGAGHIGGEAMDEEQAGTVLNRALDLGITLFDTARGYGLSEERIGRHLSWRRQDCILSTKVGYGVEGVPDWTGECVTRGIERAMRMLQTDYIDIVHLHSCPEAILRQGEVISALLRAREAGKIRAAAYSGDNDALEFAAGSGLFDGIETSLNICDQRVIGRGLRIAREAGLGVIAKRPLANGPWRYPEYPDGQYVAVYWKRFREMGLHTMPLNWQKEALHFTAGVPGVTSCIVGSGNPVHVEENIRLLEEAGMSDSLHQSIRSAFDSRGEEWMGEV